MYKVLRLFLTVLLFGIVTGCGDQRILEKLGLIQTTSYDIAPGSDEDESKQKLLISVTIPRPDSGTGTGSGGVNREFLTAIAQTSKGGRVNLSRQTELQLVSGQLRNTLFGLSLAKQGIWEHIDTLVRDPSISPKVKITVVNGNAHDLLAKNYPFHPRTGQYIDRMLEKESHSQVVPSTTLYQFTKDYFDDGIDPIAPMIKEAGDNVKIDGVALFQKDRYIMKIEPKQALIFAMMRTDIKQGDLNVDLSGQNRNNEHVTLSSLVSHRSVHVTPHNGNFRVDINIKVSGSVLEYIGVLDLENDKDRSTIEKLVSEYVQANANEMIAVMQKNRVDSLGLGKNIRSTLHYAQWHKMNWPDTYQRIEVKFHVNVRIKDYGMFTK
ncbi:spore germination protein [Paenibacillus cellulosilyticus]|uniref:Spore germination protein n=1 Tax=Paenibacillus cellulosilyticus TaxID=375489 RepID=A0A2V2YZU7_9BACL|nr:Ger(x)C family spore germination protein [Paenibacillus cellulosilyticus]PWV99494.1 spore germination protein [Paenibacillus cellulosilyticus]QKS44748.1 Ger(x)C family spore germination protein [Paenibacillus cellulosilyticus]